MKKVKQILAIIGIILLVGMYLSTILFAIFDPTETKQMLTASLIMTIVVPVLIWIYTFIYKLIKVDKNQ